LKAVVELPSADDHLKQMASMLEWAQTMYLSEMPDRERIAARTAVAACMKFVIATMPDGIDLVLPLRELNYALHGLDQGVPSPMLERAKKTGGRKTSISTEVFRSMAAVLMELYSKAGSGRSQAAESAAERLAEMGYRDGSGQMIAASQIEDWRDKVNEGGDSLGVKRFRKALEVVRKVQPDDPEKAIELVLERLSAFRRPDVPQVRNPQDSE
jgi:hypothetical protein